MYYAQLSKEEIAFAAFDTEREASKWIVDALGSDYSDRLRVDAEGKIRADERFCPDFTFCVHAGLEAAITANAALDPDAAVPVLRALCDAVPESA